MVHAAFQRPDLVQVLLVGRAQVRLKRRHLFIQLRLGVVQRGFILFAQGGDLRLNAGAFFRKRVPHFRELVFVICALF